MADRKLTVAVFNEAADWALPAALIERIRQGVAEHAAVEQVSTRAALEEALPSTEWLFGAPLIASRLDNRIDRLSFVQLTGAPGELEELVSAELPPRVRIAGASRVLASQSAEHAVAMLLTLLRSLDGAVRAQAERRWASSDLAGRVRDLDGATIGLIDLGRTGRQIVRRLQGFGCETIATAAVPEGEYPEIDRLLPPDRLDELLQRADVVVVADASNRTATLTRMHFEQLKPAAVLVNVGAPAAPLPDLVQALRRGRLAGACLDAYSREAVQAESPLWATPGVIVSPNLAAATPHYWRRAVDLLIENVRRLSSGQELEEDLTPV